MRIGRLYTQIFLCFLAILVITQVLTFALFIRFPGKYFHERFEQYATGHATLVKAYLEEKLRSGSITPTSKKQVLQDFIVKMGEVYGAGFWVTDSHGTLLFKSFEGPIPGASKKRICMKMDAETGAFEIERGFRRGYGLYMCIPIQLADGETIKLHSLFEPVDTSRFKKGFAIMLLAIGVFVALLVIPVARLITRRLSKLRESAIQFSRGDLSHRTSVCGKDEIAQLGSTFNLMAERLERMIQGGKELTANVSHELRSPLARIRVAEEIMREQLKKGKSVKTERHLNNIREDIHELDTLIGRILEFSKLDLHEGSFEKTPLDLSALLHSLLKRFKTTIEKKGVTLEVEIPSTVPMTGEAEGLESAFSNLLDNAVKYVPEGGRVAVYLVRESDHFQLRIYNTYRRLTHEELENLFEPFYRVADVSGVGTGLGLSITKKIIDRHKGLIHAANSENGLEFFVRIPK
ncbi:MAG TPA: HAMP domain-containing sensor histidine kinase [Desulfobacteria bacterium]|nr:HAMP domain-containing sensor histidine kinase [Desulfobacteria bacterium]